jgi:penicillin-binding protein 1A
MRTDGSVVAMVGGRDHRTAPFNRAVQARRQPGSTFKLFVYLAALRAGATADQLVSDQPIQIGDWRPNNADRQNQGLLTLEEAFARSSNLAAVRVSQAVGIPAVARAARDLGVTSRLDAVPSLALGASGVSLLELTSAYAAVARGAYPVRPVGAGAPQEARRPMEAGVRQDMLRLLHAAAARIGPAADLPVPVFGKTGTSQNFRDALFVGFAGDLVVGVWVGNDDERPMNRVYGAALPARIWAGFMQSALAGQIEGARSLPFPPMAGPEEPDDPPPQSGAFETFRPLFGL